MSIVWINPVIDSMYDACALDGFLRRYGHKRIHVVEDWGRIVKEKYGNQVCNAGKAVADVRCPKVKEILKKMEIKDQLLIPDIEPILIHCGREISRRIDLKGEDKIMITPCRALADMGNNLGLSETRFVSWNDFLRQTGECPVGEEVKESPIPPGFFDSLSLKTVSYTGEKDIRQALEQGSVKEVQLVEMLFCEGGCHTGDGVRMDVEK